MEDLKKELEHLGLSDKEASVYLAALEMGPSPVQDISHKSKVNRATTYVMIESLAGRGLMSTFQKGKKRFYAAESPDRLMSIIENQQKTLKEKQAELETAMPMLAALYNAEGAKPQVRYLEGPEGVATVRQIMERLRGEFIEIVPIEVAARVNEIMGDERKEHHHNLKQQSMKYRVLAVMETPDLSKLGSMGAGEYRVISADKFPIHGNISVRDDHVFLFSFKSAVMSVVIRSQEIADTIRALFEMAWENAESAPSKKTQKE